MFQTPPWVACWQNSKSSSAMCAEAPSAILLHDYNSCFGQAFLLFGRQSKLTQQESSISRSITRYGPCNRCPCWSVLTCSPGLSILDKRRPQSNLTVKGAITILVKPRSRNCAKEHHLQYLIFVLDKLT